MQETEPKLLLVKGKDEDGCEVEVDVGLLLASDEAVRANFQNAVQKLLDSGLPASYAISVGIIVSEEFDGGPAIIVFPKNATETSLLPYIVQTDDQS